MSRPPGLPETWPPTNNGNGGPWWVRAAERFGVITVIAAFLIWFLAGNIAGEIKGLREDVRSHMREQSVLIFYLQQICRNGASTSGACEPPR